MHSFINFVLAPERSGLFESTFWQTVMQACFAHDAVYHVACAVGALQDQILHQPVRGKSRNSVGLAFALRQCNQAINLLVASTSDSENGSSCDPGIPLITCVLFAIFEALNGDADAAIMHALQGRKLLSNIEVCAQQEGRESSLMDPMTVRPVIGGLEIQAKAIQGSKMDTSGGNIRPPMPDIERIHGLEHANSTLQYTYIAILTFCQSVRLNMSRAEILALMELKAEFFCPWLEKWESAFSSFLFRCGNELSPKDMQRAKVLKANHLSATMLAAIDQSGSKDLWVGYNAECKAIIDLSASVLNTYSFAAQTILSSFQFPYLTFGLWVAEPLFIVMARCRSPELQRQAAGLLSGQPRADYAEQVLSRHSQRIDVWDLAGRKDTDEWDIEQWIEFCMRTRLDAAMATYFARLPSGYIDKPVYYRTSA